MVLLIMINGIKKFMSLISFFTTIPTGYNDIVSASESFYLIPLVGLIEGSIICLVSYALIFRPIIDASILLLSHIVLTGGLHLDGFADYSDAIGSGKIGEGAIKIAKDPRKGSFAIIFTALIIIIRFSTLCVLFKNYQALLLSYLIGLEGSYLISLLSKPPKYQGLGWLFIKKSKDKKLILINVLVYLIITFFITYLLKNIYVLIPQLSLLSIPFILKDSERRFGYVNGDVIGFTIETVEVISLLLFSVM